MAPKPATMRAPPSERKKFIAPVAVPSWCGGDGVLDRDRRHRQHGAEAAAGDGEQHFDQRRAAGRAAWPASDQQAGDRQHEPDQRQALVVASPAP